MISAEDAMPRYSPRGLGLGSACCFVCGKNDRGVQDDMAAFVAGKQGGEEVVEVFRKAGCHAELDYRPYEPDWVQVKVGACKEHKPNLEQLYRLTREKRWIDLPTIEEAKSASP